MFSFLSINVEQDSSFAVMDLFRLFDRSGRGNVFIEEFVAGVIEKLSLLHANLGLINAISDELIQIDTRPMELAIKLDKAIHNNTDKQPMLLLFRANFKAMLYSLNASLKLCHQQSHDKGSNAITVLTIPIMSRYSSELHLFYLLVYCGWRVLYCLDFCIVCFKSVYWK